MSQVLETLLQGFGDTSWEAPSSAVPVVIWETVVPHSEELDSSGLALSLSLSF